MQDERYEDTLTPAHRMRRRLVRRFTWWWKGLRGQPRTILVELRWRLGDEIMALPIYSELKRHYPHDTVYAWVNNPTLLEENPNAAAVKEAPGWVDRYIFLREDARAVPRVEHYAALAGVSVPIEQPHVFAHERPAPFELGEGYIAVCAGATWQPKRWPPEKWREVIATLQQEGHRVVALGSEGEYPGAGEDLTGKTSVDDAAHVLQHARLFIGGDSGLMHLSLAVGTPALCLFGPTAPEMLAPSHRLLRAVTNARDCQGCWNRSLEMREPGVCPRGVDECLGTITPETVLAEAHALLETAR